MTVTRRAGVLRGGALLAAGALLLTAQTFPATADPPDPDDQPQGPIVWDANSQRARTAVGAGPLTGPRRGSAEEIALAFVRSRAKELGLDRKSAESLYVAKALTLSTGATAVHVGQRFEGLRVHDAMLTVGVGADGKVLSIAGRAVHGQPTGKPTMTAKRALDIAAAAQGAKARRPLPAAQTRDPRPRTYPNVYARGVNNPSPVTSELVWFAPSKGRAMRPAWLTDVESSGQDWYETLVDAQSGTVLQRMSRYAHSGPEGDVFREQHPEAPGAVQQSTPFVGIDGSWVTDRTTSGNNVNAYLDRDDNDANDEYQPQTPAAGDPGYQHFSYPFTDAWRTTADTGSTAALDADRDAVITQLFYYTNVMHDWLYGFGFDEASGNFQVDNFGRGGSGGDPVLAEAQDGYDFGCDDGDSTPDEDQDRCRNNANFGTPPDGASPRMQMYMWIPGRPFRDGDMDGDVIAHEYGHGVSSRLVGGGNLGYANDQRGALGEGWSDVISYLKWGDAVVGEYVTGNATTGIRSVAYDNSDRTFQSYNRFSSSPHPNGEIWASVIYDIRAQIPGGIPAMTQLVLDGMKLTPANPDFIDARDALLTADGGANQCLIWSAFAGRGLGTDSTIADVDAVPTASDDIPAGCLPTADAGGPYSTPEGTDAALDGSGSGAGSDSSAGALVEYAWDLDGDGAYDDATGPNPAFTEVGQDAVHPIGLRVTDEFGNTATDSTTVTVINVAPTVAIDSITPIDEGGTAVISGTVTDPGWLDTLTATIDLDDGAGAGWLNGTPENSRPDATLAFSVEHRYGDDGTFTVQVCAADDDTTGNCSSQSVVVSNVDPSAQIDDSAAQTYVGSSAFVLKAGETLTVPADSQDAGSDDLTLTWDWGDGAISTQTSLVNPPATDPAKSPSVQPRDISLAADHVYQDACLYELSVMATDDDGGTSPADTAAVVVTGNATESRGHGWWLNQYRPKPPNEFSPQELQCYLAIVGHFSLVFDEETDVSTRAKAAEVLNDPAKAPAEVIFDQMALGAWLNFANGSVGLATEVDTDGDGVADSTFGAAMLAAESVRIDPAATSAQIKAHKDIVERLSLNSAG